jgi:hypothetical protein
MPTSNCKDDESSSSSNCSDGTNNTNGRQDWTLENSSFWWLAQLSPSHVLLGSSVPLLGGAFLGYRQAQTMKIVKEDAVSGNENNSHKTKLSQAERRQLGIRTAARALKIATFTSAGTFGLIGAGKNKYM